MLACALNPTSCIKLALSKRGKTPTRNEIFLKVPDENLPSISHQVWVKVVALDGLPHHPDFLWGQHILHNKDAVSFEESWGWQCGKG